MMVMNLPMAVAQLRVVCFALQLRSYEVETIFNLTHTDTGRHACLLSADLGSIPNFNKASGLSPKLVRLVAHNLDPEINPIVTVSMPPTGSTVDIRVWDYPENKNNSALTAVLQEEVVEIQSHWTKCKLNIVKA